MNYKHYLPWAVRVAAVVLLLVLVWSWNSGRQAKDELSRELERERLERARLLTEHEASKKDILREAKELIDKNADLSAEVERLKKTAGTVKVVEVTKWRTKEVVVGGDPRPPVTPPPGGEPSPSEVCVLAKGDTGHVEVAEVVYDTRAGNTVIVGKGTCVRDTPTPTVLFASVIEAPLSTSIAPPEAPEKRWGAGAYVGFSKDGWAVGPAVALPPLHLWRFQLEAVLAVGLGPGGQFQGGASGVIRW